jgi:hypothetical protein
MPISAAIDRFEGKSQELAVILLPEKHVCNIPRSLLPPDAKPGDALKIHIEIDPVATAQVARETRDIQAELKKSDPGGDIEL